MDIDSLLDTVKAKVACGHCGAESERTVGWLKANAASDCAACGAATDLTTPEWKARIQAYIDACTGFA